MYPNILFSLIRWALTGLGVWLIKNGHGDVASVNTLVGGLIAILPALWAVVFHVNNHTAPVGLNQNFLGEPIVPRPNDDDHDLPLGPTVARGGLSLLLAGLFLSSFILPNSSFADSTNGVSEVKVPVVTPAATFAVNLTLDSVSNLAAVVGSSIFTEGIQWIITHGALTTGPGLTLAADYGAYIGQDVRLFALTNDALVIVLSHANFYGQGTSTDELGLGFMRNFAAPKWLSDFAVITKRPSRIGVGLSVYFPTSNVIHLTGRPKDILFGPKLTWSF